MTTIEYIKTAPEIIELHGIGKMKKGLKVVCSQEIAKEFEKDKRFNVVGLEKPVKKNGGSK